MEVILTGLKDYGGLLGSIVTVILTSILVIQRNKLKKNETIITESLMEASGALYFSITHILNKIKATDVTKELEDFFGKYSKDHNSLVKLKDKHIIKLFIEVEKLYYIYLSDKNNENLDKLITTFLALKNEIEKVFYAEHKIVNKEIRWYLIIESRGNVWVRMVLKVYKFISQTVVFAVCLAGIMMYAIIMDRLSNEHLLEGIYGWVRDGTELILIASAPILVINLLFYVTDDEKINWVTKILKFIIPERLVEKFPSLKRLTEGDTKVNNEKRALKEYEEEYKEWIYRERR
ncbi:MAG: hypothetical protein KZY76_00035 [Bacillus sp. (in: Bacteria)]|uniref:hypothetical protein n=1 Tax=Bacillus TaxID=1386 RepID=UPI0005075E9E|nr:MULTISPECIES: hypothetical protein [Bacillus]KFM92657.1 hypothetical protein DJ88_3434 [Bacillus paralicheniformis]MBW4884053.1 hypothetical protein [Bacillus sp. (in: firmicutes)]MBX9433963.1 hypothetical protein [Bacillus paralicheniformis]MCY1630127.1 hypothetical protein [Bacillus paralicheniformis]MDR4212490.1 hypothetical protein [Bacillus paralicheniformis]